MSDKLAKGMSRDYHLRYFVVDATKVAEKGRKIHKITSPVETVLFSKMLAAGLLFGADLKSDDQAVTLRLTHPNMENYLLVTSNNRGEVKGYSELNIANEKPDRVNNDFVQVNRVIREEIRKELKDGLFTVIKDVGMKRPYNGTTKLITGEIARDITYYFSTSEQTPSGVGLTTILNSDGSVRNAAGFIVQILPEASQESIDLLEDNLKRLPELADLLDLGKDINAILKEIVLKGFDFEETWSSKVAYRCNCSKKRFGEGIKLLGIEELTNLLDVADSLPVLCHYCRASYEYSTPEIEKMIKALKKRKVDSDNTEKI